MRIEEWQIPLDWGISTVLVEVHTGEDVLVAGDVLEELGITEDEGVWEADSGREKWALRVPYERVAAALTNNGFKHVDPVS